MKTHAFTTNAPAKVNLALHITGRRDDGYHLLETLVVFAGFGDLLTVTRAVEDHITISGPYAKSLSGGEDNLVTKARDLLRAHAGDKKLFPVAITLDKRIPVASGIGGGSADAAATLRALNHVWNLGLSTDALAELGATLGADVPMCVHLRPLLASGIGGGIQPIGGVACLPMLLVNPNIPISTQSVFGALRHSDNAPLRSLSHFGSADALADWLEATRNDLAEPAMRLVPQIADALDMIGAHVPLFSRMSGSGATCFALFRNMKETEAAANAIRTQRPDWFVTATQTLPAPGEVHATH